MNIYGVIYLATNRLTGEQYVGQTKQRPEVRFRAHEAASRTPKTVFHRAIATTGYKNFTFLVLYVAFTMEALNDAEKTVIAEYAPVYNATKGGAGRPRAVTEAERAHLSEAAKRRWANPQWRERTVQRMRDLGAAGVFTEAGRKVGLTGCGAQARWDGHTKKVTPPKDKAAAIAASWTRDDVRARRLLGMSEANKRSDVRNRRSIASRGRKPPESAIAASAKAKWKPVYCPELQISFLSRKAAAEYMQVSRSAISQAVAKGCKVSNKYSITEISFGL